MTIEFLEKLFPVFGFFIILVFLFLGVTHLFWAKTITESRQGANRVGLWRFVPELSPKSLRQEWRTRFYRLVGIVCLAVALGNIVDVIIDSGMFSGGN